MFDAATAAFRPHGFLVSSRWFVVRTHFSREIQVLQRLRLVGLCCWLPEFQAKPGGPIRALFDRYLLLQADLATDRWQGVYREPGVETILGAKGGRPTPLPHGAVDELLEQAATNGVIYPQKTCMQAHRIASGVAVRVTGGQFAGWEGVCRWSSTRRVSMLLTVMGAGRQVQVARDLVAVA